MLQSCHYSDLCSPQLPPRTTFHFNIISCCVQFVCLNGWYQFIVKYIHTTWHGVIGPWSGETTHNTCIEIKQNNKRTTIRTTCMHRKNNGRTKKEPTTTAPQSPKNDHQSKRHHNHLPWSCIRTVSLHVQCCVHPCFGYSFSSGRTEHDIFTVHP